MNGKIAYEEQELDSSGRWVYSIRVINADGSGGMRVTADGEDASDPAWSPEGSRIAYITSVFDREDELGYDEIFTVNPDGSGRTQVTDSQLPDFKSGPTWSPDGTRIAFGGCCDPPGNSDLYVVNSDGTAMTNLTSTPHRFEGDPAWSPQGDTIAFISGGGSGADIFLMDPDGGNVVQLTHTEESEWEPAWSPDGNKIVFLRDFGTQGGRLYTMNADGSGVRMVTADASSAAWAPDGSRILFNGRPASRDYKYAIYTVNPDGSHIREVIVPSLGSDPDWQRVGPMCTIVGTLGRDVIDGTGGDDVICGLTGNDTLRGLGGRDVLIGGTGDDRLGGYGGADVMRGEAGNDMLFGGSNSDTLNGGTGDDELYGVDRTTGNDSLAGGEGTDLCEADDADRVVGCP